MSAVTRAGMVGAASTVVLLILLRLWQGESYWSYSEGVYALTSQRWVGGSDLYGQMAGAQPPGVFLVGAALLSLHDSVGFLRTGVGLFQVAGGLLGAVVVWRLTDNRWAAAAAGPLALLTPWQVHELGLLTPELPAIPLLLGGALLAARPGTAAFGGALVAAAVAFKLPFAAPALGVLLLAADRRRAVAGAAAAGAVLLVAVVAVWGADPWRQAVVAQLGSERRGLGDLGGVYAQAGWSLLGLLVCAGLAVLARDRLRDPRLARVWLGLVAGMLVTCATPVKAGTSLNVLAPVEAALVPVALAGLVLAPRPRLRWVAIAAVAFTAAQTLTLVARPAATVPPFLDPTSTGGSWGKVATDGEVRRRVRVARACPPGVSVSAPPYIVFLAGRRPVGDQPDGFIVPVGRGLDAERAAVEADQPRCDA